MALSRPAVSFVVHHDGRRVLDAPATEDAGTRVRDVLGPDAAVLIPVDAVRPRVRVRGLVGPVGVHRASSVGSVYVYVNGRFVRDPVVRRAISEPTGACCPRADTPWWSWPSSCLEDVDVNAHPAKPR